MVKVTGKFVGDGWFLTLGLVFVLVVIFLPGGIMEGVRRLAATLGRSGSSGSKSAQTQPAE
jgi:hypothetical protein